MGVEVKLKSPVDQPVEKVVLTQATRQLTFRQDSTGAQRITICDEKWATTYAKNNGGTPRTRVKSSHFTSEIRELAKALLQLADAVDAE